MTAEQNNLAGGGGLRSTSSESPTREWAAGFLLRVSCPFQSQPGGGSSRPPAAPSLARTALTSPERVPSCGRKGPGSGSSPPQGEEAPMNVEPVSSTS